MHKITERECCLSIVVSEPIFIYCQQTIGYWVLVLALVWTTFLAYRLEG